MAQEIRVRRSRGMYSEVVLIEGCGRIERCTEPSGKRERVYVEVETEHATESMTISGHFQMHICGMSINV